MFSLSSKSDYGLLLLSLLAKRQKKGLTPLSLIAEKTRLPYSFLSRIASELAAVGILESKEGARGGYQLAKKPEVISIAEVIEILDGPWAPTRCSDRRRQCNYQSICPMLHAWQGYLRQKLWSLLNSYTLKDLIA